MTKRSLEQEEPLFALKEMVHVTPRTHPGFNKQGGAAKITKINNEKGSSELLKDGSAGGVRTTEYTYNVKFVLGGSEKRIDAQWLTSKDPKNMDSSELRKKRAKVILQRKEEKDRLEELRRKAEEERSRRRAEAREESLKMVQKLRQMKKQKKPLASRTNNTNTENEDVERESLKPVKIYFAEPQEDKFLLAAPPPKVPLTAEEAENVKYVMAALNSIENRFRTGEVNLEQLREELQSEERDLCVDKIENALKELQRDNRVMYREEVVWII